MVLVKSELDVEPVSATALNIVLISVAEDDVMLEISVTDVELVASTLLDDVLSGDAVNNVMFEKSVVDLILVISTVLEIVVVVAAEAVVLTISKVEILLV